MKTSPRVAHAHYAGISRLNELRCASRGRIVWLTVRMVRLTVRMVRLTVQLARARKLYLPRMIRIVTDYARATLVLPSGWPASAKRLASALVYGVRETIKTLKVAFPFGQRTSFRASERDVSALTITPRAQPKLNNEVVNLQPGVSV